MANRVMMVHAISGNPRRGYYGFSWTTLFFGCLPPLFRGDFKTFFVLMALDIFAAILEDSPNPAVMTMGALIGIGMIGWAFFYNEFYTKKLLKIG